MERYLTDQLRPAPRPYTWWDRHLWKLPAGLCFGAAAYSWVMLGWVGTGIGFALAGWAICFGFRWVR